MLIQRREGTFRLIRQHDHALLSGALAFSWRSPSGEGLPWATALAAALHDVAWTEEDRKPRLDPHAGAPCDFTTIPSGLKRAFVDRGARRLAAVEPGVAGLVAAHHRALAGEGRPEPGSALAWVRFFDTLSLVVCLTPPGATAYPAWLPTRDLEAPDGTALSMVWIGPDTFTLDPYPFGVAFGAPLPFRDLPLRRYESAESLARAWEEAPEALWNVWLSPMDARS